MIVKDEAPVIRRCLDSVRPMIDCWAIVDTGSTDGTQEIIRAHLSDLPGVLAERPWVDFAHNRNEALDLARERADYVLVIDADEVVVCDPAFALPPLEADVYDVETYYDGCTYLRKQLIKASLPWRYRGVVHEYLECPEATSQELLQGICTIPRRDGARARSADTYRRDAAALERALEQDPGNARDVFYLAQSYRDAGDFEAALTAYRRRVALGGWHEEVWYALYQAAVIEARLERWDAALHTFLAAHELDPSRAEPLLRVGAYYLKSGQHQLAHEFLRRATEIPEPGVERLFVERPAYHVTRWFEYAVACHHVGDHAGAIATTSELLRSPALPADLIAPATHNRRLSLDAIAGRGPVLAAPALVALVPLTCDGPALDDCIDSLAAQEGEELRFVLPGTVDPARLPPGDARFEAWPQALDAVLGTLCGELAETDVVVVLDPRDRLAEPRTLELLRTAFIDGGCKLIYGQHQHADGRGGGAEPAPDAETFVAHGPSLAGMSALAHRVGLLAGVTGDREAGVWENAGFSGTRFLDDVVTVRAPEPVAPPVRAPGADEPLISCLMVTRDRLRLAKAAIRSYAAQTYRSRELVIVTDGDARFRAALGRYVEATGVDGVRVVVPDTPGLTLGRLRNLAVAEARGEIVCQWDDDDYSHPRRLEQQAAFMAAEGAGACLLTDHLQLMERERLLFWVDWTDGGRLQGQDQLAPGTLMMAREVAPAYPEDGPNARRGEDSVLLSALLETVPVARLHDAGHLWLYTYHGANTFPEEHHRRMASFGIPRDALVTRFEVIRDAVAEMPLPRPTVVAGRDGLAFALR
jgi:glycosyltransferase involved in cell wall biosynthesis